eukprot:CAMPEP_0181180952 /NCGR_PEP_ID=MMETSP1096-20121128/7081_1 /TAXON_ID=156174 ORGANISM="Chrysochromulina ericina, Strain CCMP281" /NCGR_SAMPLE_ID=MMETSP1096 /ASSEMBLY_ACC=CAM_ASM_000453 /LENGTH=30 /DNA_ID= /DNA_START= /DNA_END= /DNA_ORIENTATION=
MIVAHTPNHTMQPTRADAGVMELSSAAVVL